MSESAKQYEQYDGLWTGLVRRWKVGVPVALAIALLYALGYASAGDHSTVLQFLLRDCNPIPWVGAIFALAYYYKQYDRYQANRLQLILWRPWMVWSFTAGVLAMLLLWESPLNALAPRSMAAFTLKLMGPFEIPAPLIALGVPFSIIQYEKKSGIIWRLLKLVHQPLVSGTTLLILLVFWSMSDQMRRGLDNSVIFALLPAVYFVTGVVVWLQSLHAFPKWANLRHPIAKMGYVWMMETVMMGMGTMWFWAKTRMNPIHAPHLLWGMTPIYDQRMAGIVMIALALPTMSLVFWHFWEWLETILREPESEVINAAERFLDRRGLRLEAAQSSQDAESNLT